jgi:hypothetical protein
MVSQLRYFDGGSENVPGRSTIKTGTISTTTATGGTVALLMTCLTTAKTGAITSTTTTATRGTVALLMACLTTAIAGAIAAAATSSEAVGRSSVVEATAAAPGLTSA